MSEHVLRGVAHGTRGLGAAMVEKADRLGIRLTSTLTTTTMPGPWPWSKPVVISERARFTVRADTEAPLVDFAHEFGAGTAV